MPSKLLYDLRENATTNAAMDAMADSNKLQDEPYIGPFWYDVNKEEVFGNVMTLASDKPFYEKGGKKVKTGDALYKNIWKKEEKRAKDRRFSGDYKQVPRGRVFEVEDEGFKVYVGSWVESHPEAKDDIIEVFQLPKENTEFVIDKHWDLGHGWSEKLYLDDSLEESLNEDKALEQAYRLLNKNAKAYACIYGYIIPKTKQLVYLDKPLLKYNQDEVDKFVTSFSKGREGQKINAKVLYRSQLNKAKRSLENNKKENF